MIYLLVVLQVQSTRICVLIPESMSFTSEILAILHQSLQNWQINPRKYEVVLCLEVLCTHYCAEHFFKLFSGVFQNIYLEEFVQLEFQWRDLVFHETWNTRKNANTLQLFFSCRKTAMSMFSLPQLSFRVSPSSIH